MKSTLCNLGPMLGVMGLVIWLSWPHLVDGDSVLPDLGGEKLIRIDNKLLDPQLPSTSGRNPFEPVAAPVKTAAADRPLPAAEDITEKPIAEPEIDWQKTVEMLKLRGTFVVGVRRCALINGKIYAEGDQVPTPFQAAACCKLARVLQDGIVLEGGNQRVRLAYASSTPPTNIDIIEVPPEEHSNGAANRVFASSSQGPRPNAKSGPYGVLQWFNPFARSLRASATSFSKEPHRATAE